jgi:hypothetical protein
MLITHISQAASTSSEIKLSHYPTDGSDSVTGDLGLQFMMGCFYNTYAELRHTLTVRESNSPVPWAVAPGAFLFPVCLARRGFPMAMAEQPPSFQFEYVPLEAAGRMGRGPRMEPLLYDTLRQKIQSLTDQATRIRLGPEIRPARMKQYLLRIARELNVPVTVRNVPGGVVFWRATEEDQQQAQEVAARLQSVQRQRRTPARKGRRPRASS